MALSADIKRDRYFGGNEINGVVAAGHTVYTGAICAFGAAGTVLAHAATAGDSFAGIASKGGTAGLTVPLLRNVPVWLSNSSGNPITAAMVGSTAYIEDDEKVCCWQASPAVMVPVGEVLAVSATLGVLVDCSGKLGGIDVQVKQDDQTFTGNVAVGGTLGVTSTSTFTGLASFTASAKLKYASADGGAGAVPTAASLAAAFGAPGAGTNGMVCVFNNTNGAGSRHIVIGANNAWYAAACTVA